MSQTEHFDTIVIGGGQAGLATGYYLKRQGRDFIILDANARVGDAWRKRWDSLRLFTPAPFDSLPGMLFPAGDRFPTKDAMADYLEAYAAQFPLPVRTGVRVDCLTRQGERFLVTAGERRFEANNVVVAMGNYQQPRIPAFAAELDPEIVQLHSSAYRNPSQLREGGVLLVGAGNSGADIAMEIVRSHSTWLSGTRCRVLSLPHRKPRGAVGRAPAVSDCLPSRADGGTGRSVAERGQLLAPVVIPSSVSSRKTWLPLGSSVYPK